MFDVELHMKRGSIGRGFWACLLFGVLGLFFTINGAYYTKRGARIGFLVHVILLIFIGICVAIDKGYIK